MQRDFPIERASAWGISESDPPCYGARLEFVEMIIRFILPVEKLSKEIKDRCYDWHNDDNGCAVGRRRELRWIVHDTSLDELAEKYGPIIVSKDVVTGYEIAGYPLQVEIYDAYIE